MQRENISVFYPTDEVKKGYPPQSSSVGVFDKDDNSDSLTECFNCRKYTELLQAMDRKQKQSHRKWRKLKGMLHQMEIHNQSIVKSTDDAVRDFEHYIMKLEIEILERDDIIAKLAEQIHDLKHSSDDLCAAMAEQKEQAHQREVRQKMQLTAQKKEIDGLKLYILRQVSQKTTLQRLAKEQRDKFEVEKQRIEEINRVMESEINSKEKLILFLSNSNNELLAQLIELREKFQIDLSTCVTQKKIPTPDCSQANKELVKQNEKLLNLNSSLHSNLKVLIKETEEMEIKLVKTKLEKDIWVKRAENKKSKSFDVGGNFIFCRNTEQYSPQTNRQMAGTIRVNKF